MKSIKVNLDNGSVDVSKLPLGKYSELLKAIKELPKHLEGLQGMNNQDIMANLPTLVAQALPDVIGVLEIATPLKREQLEKLGLDEAVRLVLAVIEVNNYKDIYNNIKKVTARPELVK